MSFIDPDDRGRIQISRAAAPDMTPCDCTLPAACSHRVHRPPIAPGPGVFDAMAVTGWRPTDPQPSTVALSDADVERIARRVAELLRGAP